MRPPIPNEDDSSLALDEEEPLDVLDLPQLYQSPPAPLLLSTLRDLRSVPLSWENIPRLGPRGGRAPDRRRSKIKNEGVPRYLTNIIASKLAWIDDDEEKEQIWETAAQRLSERSGRTGMGAISRSFFVPLLPLPDGFDARDNTQMSAQMVSVNCASDALEITLYEPPLTGDNLGLKTWASSYLLAKRLCCLRSNLPKLTPDKAILELGAGTGLVGLAAAAVFQTHVFLTDLPEIVPNLESNLRTNISAITTRGGSAQVSVLDWSEPSNFTHPLSSSSPPHTFFLTLAADPIYSSKHPALLADTINYHLSKSKDARAVIELPLREAFAAERQDLRDRLAGIGLVILEEGEEVGFDDWVDVKDGDEQTEVRCWWSVWGRD